MGANAAASRLSRGAVSSEASAQSYLALGSVVAFVSAGLWLSFLVTPGVTAGLPVLMKVLLVLVLRGGQIYLLVCLRDWLHRRQQFLGADHLVAATVVVCAFDGFARLGLIGSGADSFSVYRLPVFGLYSISVGYGYLFYLAIEILSIALGYALLRLPPDAGAGLLRPYALLLIGAGVSYGLSGELVALISVPAHLVLALLFAKESRRM